MPTVREINSYFDSVAPYNVRFEVDNVGLIIESKPFVDVTKVITALDITSEVIDEAIEFGAQLIISHHPIIFHPIMNILSDDAIGKRIIKLIANNISVICLHTNFDVTTGGVCDELLKALGAKPKGLLNPLGKDNEGKDWGLSRVGVLPKAITMQEYLAYIENTLNPNGLRYYDSGRSVFRISCAGGLCNQDEVIMAYKKGCDTYVAGDIIYDIFIFAKEVGMNIIDAGHFCTENVVVPVYTRILRKQFPNIDVRESKRHCQIIKFF